VLVRVGDPGNRARLRGILELALADRSAWKLGPDGTWTRLPADPGTPRLQATLMARAGRAIIDR